MTFYAKILFFKCLLLILSISLIANAQTSVNKKTKVLPQYIAKSANPYYSQQLKRAVPKASIWLYTSKNLKATKNNKKKIVKATPKYVFKSVKPFYYKQFVWACSKEGIWKNTVKMPSERSKAFGKEDFTELKRLFYLRRNKEALAKTMKAFTDARETGNREAQVEILTILASFCEKYKIWDEAELYYKAALTEQLLNPEHFGYGIISLHLANTLVEQKKYDEAQDFISFSANEYSQAGNRYGLAVGYLKIADIYTEREDLVNAETTLLTKALPLFTSAENNRGRLLCFEKLGDIYAAQKRYSEAKWFYIQQKLIALSLKDQQALFHALVNLGKVKTAIKDYSLAAKDFKEANYLLKKLKSDQLSLMLEDAYWKLYQQQGNKKLSSLSGEKYKKLQLSITKSTDKQQKAAIELLKSTKEQKPVLLAAVLSK